MARSPSEGSRAATRRTLQVVRDFLLIFGVAFLVPYLGYRLLHHPRGTAPTVAMPAVVTTGTAPGTFASGDYRLTVSGVRALKQSDLPPGLNLTYRARPTALVDYLLVSVTVADVGASALPLTFAGSGQDVRLLLASTDPESFNTNPVDAEEATVIAGQQALGAGTLAPGERRSGVLVYAIEPYRKGLELVLVPVYGVGVTPAQGPRWPAFEIDLPDPR